MATGEISSTISVAGQSFTGVATRTGDGQNAHDPTLPAALSGTLTTRTDADTGVITLAEGHGITDADTVNVFSAGAVQYGCTVTAYDSTTISIDLGSGDDLPAQDTTVLVAKQVEIESVFDGDDVAMIVAMANLRAHIEFQEAGGTSILGVELTANEPWQWLSSQGLANPLTGNPVGKIQASAGTAASTQLRIGVVRDSTP